MPCRPPAARRHWRAALHTRLALEGALHLQGHGDQPLLEIFPRPRNLGGKLHGINSPHDGGRVIAPLAGGVVQQAGVAVLKVQAAGGDLLQVVTDHQVVVLLVAGYVLGLIEQLLVVKA